ncbi:MAG: hypothetical protein JW969_01285 [Spirochaetales bacterium]|nr:hypothetical protein [Spirochaetales bacterium]
MKRIIIPLLVSILLACDMGNTTTVPLEITCNAAEFLVHNRIEFSTNGSTGHIYTWKYKRDSDADFYILDNVDIKTAYLYFVEPGDYTIRVENISGEIALETITIADRTPGPADYDFKHTFTHTGGDNYAMETVLPDNLLQVINDDTNKYIQFDIRFVNALNADMLYHDYEYDSSTITTTISSLSATFPADIANPITHGDVDILICRTVYFMDSFTSYIDAADIPHAVYYQNDAFAIVLYDGITAFDVYY